GMRARLLAHFAAGPRRRLPLSPCLDRRGVRLARAPRQVSRDQPLSAQLALRRLESGVRPPGARLARDLRAPGRAQQLLEQLRALPLPGKADPADDPEGPARR